MSTPRGSLRVLAVPRVGLRALRAGARLLWSGSRPSTAPSQPPAVYYRGRATLGGLHSVMWLNDAYNKAVTAHQRRLIRRWFRSMEGPRRCALDLCCGLGRLTPCLASLFDRVLGVDIPEMVVKAQTHVCLPNVAFLPMKITDWALGQEQFDGILSVAAMAVSCYYRDLDDVAGHVYASLRPGGRLLLMEPFHKGSLGRYCVCSASEARRVFLAKGFRLRHATGLHFAPFRTLLSGNTRVPPALTRGLYRLGESLLGVGNALAWGDYSFQVLDRPSA